MDLISSQLPVFVLIQGRQTLRSLVDFGSGNFAILIGIQSLDDGRRRTMTAAVVVVISPAGTLPLLATAIRLVLLRASISTLGITVAATFPSRRASSAPVSTLTIWTLRTEFIGSEHAVFVGVQRAQCGRGILNFRRGDHAITVRVQRLHPRWCWWKVASFGIVAPRSRALARGRGGRNLRASRNGGGAETEERQEECVLDFHEV
ncbi:MAG TPA: hypothetical protein VF585_03760 [Chthoniobacterales bacterium]